MKKLFVSFGLLVAFGLVSVNRETTAEMTVLKDNARAAFAYLNQVRQNPDSFSKSIGVSLKSVKARPILIWNDTLAKVAEARAADMIKRSYFSHVNPDGEGANILIHRAGYELDKEFLTPKSANYFESIQGGYEDGVEMINDLIVDEGEADRGHRKHLLGIDDWNSNLTDIGIGMVSSPDCEYGTISVVIIAKHGW
jgi:uncharacterized protein YkwD